MINEFISISCDNKGNLLDQNSSQEQKKFYNDNKDEIKDRINQISIMWHKVYED